MSQPGISSTASVQQAPPPVAVVSDDPAWKYCTQPDLNKRQSLMCKFCDKICTSGVTRIKWHLSCIKNNNVLGCPKVPSDVRQEMVELLLKLDESKDKKSEVLEKLRGKVNLDHSEGEDNSEDSGNAVVVLKSKNNSISCKGGSIDKFYKSTIEDFRAAMITCITTMIAKDEDQDKIIEELNSYQAQLESFGTDIATRQRKNKLFDPAKWWLNHGTSSPNLKNLAVKILSLTCSSSACERNFSTFEQVHAKKRSRLLSGRLRDLVFVKFNSRMKHKRDNKMRDPIEKIIDVLEDESNEFITGIVPEDTVEVEEAEPTPQPEASTSQAQTKRKRRAKKRKKSIHSLLNSVQEEAMLSDSSGSSSSESEGNQAQDDDMLCDNSQSASGDSD